MKRLYQRWHSPSLGRDMELLAFGHAGARVIAFPTSCGRFFDWEERGLHHALGEHLERGWVQLFCVDSVDRESWYARQRHPGERAWRQHQYDRYVLHELLPFSESQNPNPYVIATGASFGGYHAICFGLRHPDRVGRVLSMSGLCDIKTFTDGYYDENVYLHNPCDFIANEHDAGRLAALRRQDIILAVGCDDRLCDSNRRLSEELWKKGIGNALRVWDGFAHDWSVWAKMLPLYIGGHD
jgi:esterase/lipase superfamily enzyme